LGKSQRTKGAAGEREVCAIFATALQRDVKRHIGQARDGGNDITVRPLSIEVKRRKSLKTFMDWWRQAKAACTPESFIPVVVMREDNGPWLVSLTLADFLYLTSDKLID